MIESVRNAFGIPELRRKILLTFGLLGIYRLVSNIPVPGVELGAWSNFVASGQGLEGLLGVLNLLSGGAIANFSVMAMGVYPYITASIIIQLLTPVVPYLEELSQEGESGRNRINRITYYLTIPLAFLQAIGQINLIGVSFGGGTGSALAAILPNFGFTDVSNILPTLTTLLAMTGGTMFALWLGEQITENGVGQGVSLIIFAGIASAIPLNMFSLFSQTQTDQADRWISLIVFVALTILTIFVIVYIQEGERRIPVQYGRRVRGRKVYQGQSTHIPLKVNTAGMIPIIFAQSILTFPALAASFFVTSAVAVEGEGFGARFARTISQGFSQGADPAVYPWALALFWLFMFLAVVGFTFFYTDVMVRQQRLAQNLQQRGGFIPGIRPGKRTEDYINAVVRRITFAGAFYLGLVAITPGILQFLGFFLDIEGLGQSALIISGSGLIIVVGVVLDTMRQIEAQLVMRNYESSL